MDSKFHIGDFVKVRDEHIHNNNSVGIIYSIMKKQYLFYFVIWLVSTGINDYKGHPWFDHELELARK